MPQQKTKDNIVEALVILHFGDFVVVSKSNDLTKRSKPQKSNFLMPLRLKRHCYTESIKNTLMNHILAPADIYYGSY